MQEDDDYIVDFDFCGDWFGLTLRDGTREEAERLAAEYVAQFNPLHLRVSKDALQRQLVQIALNAFESGPVVVAVAYTEGGTLLADLVVYVYGEDGVRRPSPQEYLPKLVKWSYAEVKGEPLVAEVELPVGPAVRVQAMLAQKRRFGWGSKLSESLRYAVWPTGREEILLVEVDWQHFERTDEIVGLVAELVPTMRLVPTAPDVQSLRGHH
ncbi:hypothetical protein [Streptomyces spectabilis]|uniref:Uncharacterized protein n=1 Tax=Streptomyces spectabilis TaxID=68270 RepID=A0A5P2X685_STRST|nr:hypothetical protein [Streptomyces spectabilis]MBB5103440.1 hypothetical protein [Streptomyces spectabilis]MCI3902630.1 hypothetical protein [Streptomyces spectabilis]QEV59951.1 hypothetical protein CP982_15380 [Streptomyces spectabilis]GGV49160.1 hypothetical protein GCM10010245_77420 [Streptomyces spectabilis]